MNAKTADAATDRRFPGAWRIVPNAANEQAETVVAFTVEEALANFKRRRPGVEVWDVIELRRAR